MRMLHATTEGAATRVPYQAQHSVLIKINVYVAMETSDTPLFLTILKTCGVNALVLKKVEINPSTSTQFCCMQVSPNVHPKR